MASIKLKDISTKIGSGATPKGGKAAYKTEGISLIRSMNVYDSQFKEKDLAFIDDSQATKLSNVEVEPVDILLNITGASVARCCLVPEKILPARVNQHVAIIRIDKSLADPRFVYMCLISPKYKSKLLSLAQGGATREALTKTTIEEFELDLPQLEVQSFIADSYLAYDSLIENNNRRIAILEDMAQSLYREWFVNFRYPNHQDNVDADGNPKLIDSTLGQIPEGWQIVALEELCNKITDGSHKSPKSVDVGVPMASVKDMHDFGINASKCRQISYEDYEDLKRQDSVVKANDILVAKDGSYLKHTFVVEKELEMALLSSIAIIRPNEKVKPHWLAYCLRSPLVKERMKNYVSGAAIPRIILKDFRKFNLFIPPQELMDEWNSIVEGMVKQCWNLVSRNENLKQQRDMLLPKLISGQIELKD